MHDGTLFVTVEGRSVPARDHSEALALLQSAKVAAYVHKGKWIQESAEFLDLPLANNAELRIFDAEEQSVEVLKFAAAIVQAKLIRDSEIRQAYERLVAYLADAHLVATTEGP